MKFANELVNPYMNPTPPQPRRATVYPADVIAANPRMDVIDPAEVKTIDGLFRERVSRSADKTACIQYCVATDRWVEHSWRWMAEQVERWRRAMAADQCLGLGLGTGTGTGTETETEPERGARAAIRMGNRHEWVLYDQACMAAGLVVTPLYAEDRPDNVAYILEHTGARLFLVENAGMWLDMAAELPRLSKLARVVVLDDAKDAEDADDQLAGIDDPRVMSLSRWLAQAGEGDMDIPPPAAQPDDLATIVYTSGTTGKPKGVMLSHANMLLNAHAGLKGVPVFPDDKFLSFLPLSHMFERTVGYYLPMMAGASVAYNRSIPELADDLAANRPTILITVPRIFERAYGVIQTRLEQGPALRRRLFAKAVAVGWRRFEIAQGRAAWGMDQLLWPLLKALVAKKIRARFGGNLRFVISGGAPLGLKISRVFIALGVEVLQGYGLTETGPTLTVNTPARNKPSSIGLPFIGAEIRLSEGGELQARSPSVMLGYWQNEEATRRCIDAAGWFATGDLAAIDEDGFISITGRLKEIIVLATGEKVPPADMESAICDDPLFEQVMVMGEGRAFLCALIVLNPERWPQHAAALGVDPNDAQALASERVEKFMLEKVADRLRDFPGYAAVRRLWVTTEPWTVTGGAITPTLKIKRPVLRERFKAQIENLYAGHR